MLKKLKKIVVVLVLAFGASSWLTAAALADKLICITSETRRGEDTVNNCASSLYCVGKPEVKLAGYKINHSDKVFGGTISSGLGLSRLD